MAINIRAAPFLLDESSEQWVNETFSSMTQEEKINQLFVDMFWKDSKKQIATLLIGKGIRLDREIKTFSFVAYCSKRKQDAPYQCKK